MKIKYIIVSIIETIHGDLKGSYDSLARPKELMNFWFYIMVIFAVTEKWKELIIVAVLYIATYIWRIIKQGRWKHKMRKDYLR